MDFHKIQQAQEKFGGPFAMTAVLQKRVRELIQGSRPYVETDKIRPVDIALEEILAGRIGIEYLEESAVPPAPADIFGAEV